MTLSTAVQPFFDDYNEDKQFYQILFRPSYAIQTRELNQMQTILQKQIERHGRHVFAEGSMVIPGQTAIDLNFDYVKLLPTYLGSTVSEYLDELVNSNVELVGQTSGVRARILHWEPATDTDPVTIFVRYVSSDVATGTVKTFAADESLISDGVTPRGMTVAGAITTPIGVGSSANIQRGVYFVNGKFVLVKPQTIILDRYSKTPTYDIGLKIVEEFVSPEQDSSLLDNSQGSTNYSAPGAYRYFIDLELIKKSPGETENKNFILLSKVDGGRVDQVITQTNYSELEKTLARRTYDESGDYVVRPFNLQLREHRNNDRGEWAASTNYQKGDVVKANGSFYVAENAGLSGATAPSHQMGVVANGGVNFLYEQEPLFNNGVFTEEQYGDANSIAVGLEPGKAYVRGYEIEKISTKYLKVSKALDYASQRSAVLQPSLGSMVNITNMYGPLDTTGFLTVDLRDTYTTAQGTAAGSSIGSAKARYIEWYSGTPGDNAAIFTLGLFDITLNSGKKFEYDVRQIYYNNAGVDFTADVVKTSTQLTGAITTTSASTAVTGLGTKFTTELHVGETIRYYNGATELVSKIAAINSDTSLTLAAVASASLTNVVYYSLTSQITDSANDALLFPASVEYVRSMRSLDNPNASTTAYYTKQKFSDTCVAGDIAITVTSGSDTFAAATDRSAFLVVNLTTGAILNPTISLNSGKTTATITVGTGNNGNVISVIAKVRRVMKERSKTLVRAYTEDFTTQSVVQQQSVTLSNVDAQKLRKVVQFITTATGLPVAFGSPIPSSGVTEIDITSAYILKGNQKDSYYDFSLIQQAPGAVFPESPIRVYYDYYSHGNTGDYFNVDSYATSPENPPLYKTTTGTTINLRDYIDFRPTRLTSTTWSSSFMPAIAEDFTTDFSYFLARRDNIVLTSTGSFMSVQGAPGVYLTEPLELDNSMLLYKLDLTPVTETVNYKNIKITRINNRRYTMKDIGELDSRLQNVEYYTALSLLEEQTKNLQLFDSNGNLTFKNGFLVDSFSNMLVGDTNSNNFRCSIDTTDRIMRPSFNIASANMIEKSINDAERASLHYAATGGLFTLPYVEVPAISQTVASHAECVTPYIQLNFIGSMTLNPESDDWYETSHEPDVIINDSGIVPTDEITQNDDEHDKDPRKRWFQHNRHYHSWNNWQENWASLVVDESGRKQRRIKTVTTNLFAKVEHDLHNAHGHKHKARQRGNGNRVIQLDIVPYIRAEQIAFHAKGMKPNTRVYPFFDSVNVRSYCTGAYEMAISGSTGDFDDATDAGLNSQQTARSDAVTNKPARALNRGDVIHNGAGGNIELATATAVVLHYLNDSGSGSPMLYLHNVVGTFGAGNTVHGTISGVQGTVTSITAPTADTLKTNIYGECVGVFSVPSTDQMKFRAGTRVFTLTDSVANGTDWTTKAQASYTAHGVIDPPVPSTRPPVTLPSESAPEPEPQVWPEPTPDPVDPPAVVPVVSAPAVDWFLAESIRLYGEPTPAPTPPAPAPAPSVESPVPAPAPAEPTPAPAPWVATEPQWTWPVQDFMETGAGGGGGDPLAQSFSVPANDVGMFVTSMDFYFQAKDKSLPVNLELREMLNGVPTTTVVPGSVVTKLPKDITISADGSVATRMTFAHPVYLEPGKDYALVLSSDSVYYYVFVSQLGEDDILTGDRIAKQPYLGSLFKSQNASVWTPDQMLDLKFTINRAKFDISKTANIRMVNQKIGSEYLEANSVFTRTGSNKIRVYMRNHGHVAGSKVTIANVGTALNGIPAVELNATHTVIASDFDSFVVQATTNATSTGYTGTAAITVTHNIRYDLANLAVTQLILPGTTIKHFMSTARTDFTKKLFSIEVQPNENNEMPEPSLVMSQENEDFYNAGYKSLDVYSQMMSASDFVSPVLDIQRYSMILVSNRIGDSYFGKNIADLDLNTLTSSNLISFSGNQIVTANSTIKTAFLKARVGRVITVSGAANSANNTSGVITSVAADGSSITVTGVSFTTESTGSTVTLSMGEMFVSEISPDDGSSDAKYVIKEMSLIDPASNLRVFFDVNMNQTCSVDLYYRIAVTGEPNDTLKKTNWTLATPVTDLQTFTDSNSFFGASYNISSTSLFDKAQVKMVMRSTDSSAVPLIKQLRIIATS